MWWKILLIIAAAIFLLLLCNIRIILQYSENFKVYIGFGFIKIDVFKFLDKPKKAKKQKPKKKKEKDENKEQKSEEKKKDSILKQIKNIRGANGIIEFILDLIDLLGTCSEKFRKHIVFRDMKIYYTVTGDDASKTALKYGRICAVIYPLTEVLKRIGKSKKSDVRINADFLGKKDSGEFYAHITYRLLFILSFALGALARFVKTLISHRMKNEKAIQKNKIKTER